MCCNLFVWLVNDTQQTKEEKWDTEQKQCVQDRLVCGTWPHIRGQRDHLKHRVNVSVQNFQTVSWLHTIIHIQRITSIIIVNRDYVRDNQFSTYMCPFSHAKWTDLLKRTKKDKGGRKYLKIPHFDCAICTTSPNLVFCNTKNTIHRGKVCFPNIDKFELENTSVIVEYESLAFQPNKFFFRTKERGGQSLILYSN